jgi:protocatechuate 3,4-dioxygenase beta subunit
VTRATESVCITEVCGSPDRHRTPDQILGPYFPAEHRLLARDDLTSINENEGRALGEIIEVRGRVLDLRGKPVGGVRLTIWQADTFGRYAHPNDPSSEPPDPNFVGSVTMRSGENGEYRIKTVKPGAYSVGPDWMRPPHIHIEVQGQFERLVTQMYFPGEPLNAKDRALMSAPRPDLLIARLVSLDNPTPHRTFNFDIVLTRG